MSYSRYLREEPRTKVWQGLKKLAHIVDRKRRTGTSKVPKKVRLGTMITKRGHCYKNQGTRAIGRSVKDLRRRHWLCQESMGVEYSLRKKVGKRGRFLRL